MIKAKEIKDKNHIKEILDNLKPQDQFDEIFKFLNITSCVGFLIERILMWDYLRGYFSFEKLINKIEK